MGVYTSKGVVGYDLTRLIIGSEGTLGIVTKVSLRVYPKPTNLITIYLTVKSIKDALNFYDYSIHLGFMNFQRKLIFVFS